MYYEAPLDLEPIPEKWNGNKQGIKKVKKIAVCCREQKIAGTMPQQQTLCL
jgi:hypothetical protein